MVPSSPPPALAINQGRIPFLIALNVAIVAAVPLCGAIWHGGPSGTFDWQPDPFTWRLLMVSYVVTLVAILATPLRVFAGLVPLFAVPALAGLWAYASNPDRSVYHVAPLFEMPSVWGVAIAFAVLAALAGRRAEIPDARDRNGLFVGMWLVAIGAVIALVAIGTHDWLLASEVFTDHITSDTDEFVGLRRDAFITGAAVAAAGIAFALAAFARRRRRRQFLAAASEGQLAGWSVVRGDDPALPLFLDPSRRPTGILVRGTRDQHGPGIARVRG